MANEIKKAEPQFSVALADKLTSVKNALPATLNKDLFVQNALALINENPALQKYPRSVLIAGLLKASCLGLDAYAKECYLIPYGDKLQFQIDYRGAMKLAKQYSIRKISEIGSDLVREGDRFEVFIEHGMPDFSFKPKPFSDAPIVGAFAYIRYEDGGVMYETMSLSELENTRRHSKASNSMAWRDFFGEMARKTVIHRLCKKIELVFDNPEQRKIYDDDMDIVTSSREIAEDEIAAGENAEEFVLEENEN